MSFKEIIYKKIEFKKILFWINNKIGLKNLNDKYFFFFLSLVFLQSTIWFQYTQHIKPDFTITPLPPSKLERAFLSFGDDSLLYRSYAFKLQNAGDTFGETTPLKDYDYQKLEKWFYALNDLDNKSEYVPSIAGFYYSQSQSVYDNEYIISYLTDYAKANPIKNWRWFTHAAYLARYKLGDFNRAIEISKNIINLNNPEIPAWAKAMAFFIAQKEDECLTIEIASQLMADGSFNNMLEDDVYSTRSGEYNFMYQAIKKIVADVQKDSSIITKCQNKKHNLKK